MKKEIYWNQIIEVKVSILSKRITLKTKVESISVNGAPSSYAKFINIAKKKVSPIIACDDLSRLYSKLNPVGK